MLFQLELLHLRSLQPTWLWCSQRCPHWANWRPFLSSSSVQQLHRDCLRTSRPYTSSTCCRGKPSLYFSSCLHGCSWSTRVWEWWWCRVLAEALMLRRKVLPSIHSCCYPGGIGKPGSIRESGNIGSANGNLMDFMWENCSGSWGFRLSSRNVPYTIEYPKKSKSKLSRLWL